MDTVYELQSLGESSQLSAETWSSLWTFNEEFYWFPDELTKIAMLHEGPCSPSFGLPGPQSALLSSTQSDNVGSNNASFSNPCFVPGSVFHIIVFHGQSIAMK